jgi:hypothetical protein
MVSGGINGEAQSFHLKHALTVGIRDHGYAHIPSLCSQHLRLHSTLYMHPIRKRIPHNVRMTGTSRSQDLDPVNCAGIGGSVRYHASPAVVELLHHLSVATLTFASDLAFGVLLYLVLQLTAITGHCAVVYAQKFRS